MPTQQSDGELITACNRGEAWAWDALVDRYKGLVFSVALRSGLPEDDAADVFQTVFARFLEHLDRIHEPQGLAAWFITTTKRESWRAVRKRQREPAHDEIGAMADAAAQQPIESRPYERRLFDRELIRQALALIGPRCRELLTLLYLAPQEPTYEEIGEQLRMPVGSIGPTRARCLAKMREIFQRMGMKEV